MIHLSAKIGGSLCYSSYGNKMTNRLIKTIDQFRKTYFPKEYERQKLSKMGPVELGKYLAKNLVIEIKKKMR